MVQGFVPFSFHTFALLVLVQDEIVIVVGEVEGKNEDDHPHEEGAFSAPAEFETCHFDPNEVVDPHGREDTALHGEGEEWNGNVVVHELGDHEGDSHLLEAGLHLDHLLEGEGSGWVEAEQIVEVEGPDRGGLHVHERVLHPHEVDVPDYAIQGVIRVLKEQNVRS